MIKRKLTAARAIILGGAFALGFSNIMAQTFGLEYTAEWQTDFKGAYDWLNLLKASANLPLCRNLSFEALTISTAKSGADPLVSDLLTYSNLEAGNIPLTLARLGFDLKANDVELFAGINNVNEDYFTSDLTSFFTNSSCGIAPTISCNYDIANYPLAAWCVHYRQKSGDFSWQTSLYPGKGHLRFWGHDNLFNLNFRRNGIFSISSIDYKRNDIYCILGFALHYGVRIGDEDGEQIETPASTSPKNFSASPWLLSEINLPCNLGLLVHGSISTVANGCKSYAGIGIVHTGDHAQTGISFNYASFTYAKEYDLELSVGVPLFQDKITLQPSIHFIKSGYNPIQCVGLLRFNISLDFD